MRTLYVMLYVSLGLYFTACDNTARFADCLDGCSMKNGLDGTLGPKGEIGVPGSDGNNGNDGHSAAFSQGVATPSLCPNGGVVLNAGVDINDDGVLQVSEIKSTSVTCNGLDGLPSVTVPNPFAPIALIDPCGYTAGHYNEVFIKFSNGTILASFSDNANGQNTRFSVLVPGSYITTDGTGCKFTVDSSGNITNEHF